MTQTFNKHDKAAVAKALDQWEEKLKDLKDGQVIDYMVSMGFRGDDVQLFLGRRKLKPDPNAPEPVIEVPGRKPTPEMIAAAKKRVGPPTVPDWNELQKQSAALKK